MLAIWNSNETAAIAAHFQNRVVEDVNTVFNYSSLTEDTRAGTGVAESNSGTGGIVDEDESWMDEPLESASQVIGKQGSTKGKGKGKGKGAKGKGKK